MKHLHFGASFTLGALMLFAVQAQGQTDAEIQAGFRLNLSNPGARSLALAGAFIGLADDATAAYTNPAGLTVLSTPEVSAEVRHWKYTSVYVDSGHAFGPPTGDGIDTISGIRLGESSSDTDGLSFLSFVYPRERWAIAFYRHEQANFAAAQRTNGAFFEADGFSSRLSPVDGTYELDIVNLGVSLAIQVSENLSLGFGVSNYELEIDSRTTRFDVFFDDPPVFSPDNIFNIETMSGEDDDFGLNLGFLWTIDDSWQLGGVYRQGGSFDFLTTNESEFFATQRQPATLNVPDQYGLGVAFNPTERFTITFDPVLVEYSSLTENTTSIFGQIDPDAAAAASRLEADDALELRLGFEYVWPTLQYPFALRAGLWQEEDHRIAFQGAPDSSLAERSTALLFFEGDDELHVTLGLGIVFGEVFQLDAAADLSDLADTYSLSGVVRF